MVGVDSSDEPEKLSHGPFGLLDFSDQRMVNSGVNEVELLRVRAESIPRFSTRPDLFNRFSQARSIAIFVEVGNHLFYRSDDLNHRAFGVCIIDQNLSPSLSFYDPSTE